ncbi:unnamed protein product, partial [Iphiclides podalirius]
MFRLLMYDFAGDRFGDSLAEQSLFVCWECAALLKRFNKFKKRVHAAQEHFRVLSLSSSQETTDHTYLSQSLSTLESTINQGYDKIYFDCTSKADAEWPTRYIAISTTDNIKDEKYDIAHIVKENINLELDENLLSGIVLESPSTVVSPHIVINAEPLVNQGTLKEGDAYVVPDITVRTVAENSMDLVLQQGTVILESDEERPDLKAGYITEYMNEDEMLAFREEAKQKVQYASAVYKCELCILGFYNQQQVEEHYVTVHKARDGAAPCKVCFAYVPEARLASHARAHYARHVCRLCGRAEASAALARAHADAHRQRRQPAALIRIGDAAPDKGRRKKKKEEAETPNPGTQDLRKLLSKTTIVGYKCLECDMFFKNSRARKNHVARYHREGLQCDHCKKRFVNRTTLATHLRLHEGPPPRAECPVCGKMVRVVQLKYHVQRHQNRGRYECSDCNKLFSHLTTYHAHLKYSRAHATDQVFKFPCPMCNKGYPTKEAMQDHFNYQHLGKTSHKCPVCNKPIASRANVEKHVMRVHGEKKERPRNHVCQQCGKAFTDKKALNQHEVIHSGERPLSCDICQQTFKQKASLYTHKKRVHNVVPAKRVVEFMETKNPET